MRRRRQGKFNIVSLFFLVAILGSALWGYLFMPYYLVYFRMKEITKSVMLDWVGLNEGKARRRLGEEFRRQEIPDYVPMDLCELKTEGQERSVTCTWEVDVYYPFTDYYKTLSFEVWAMHDGVGLTTS